jgi:hypothetical protein
LDTLQLDQQMLEQQHNVSSAGNGGKVRWVQQACYAAASIVRCHG